MKVNVSLPERLYEKILTAQQAGPGRRRDEIVTGSINRYIEKYGKRSK